MRIGLDRVVASDRHGRQRAQRARAFAHASAGDRRSAACPRRASSSKRSRCARATTARLRRQRSLSPYNVAPARAEHRAVVDAHRAGADQQVVQMRQQARRATSSSTTKVRFRLFDDCEIRCTRSGPNSASTPDSRCSIERMPRPTSVIAAHGAITLTRQTLPDPLHSAAIARRNRAGFRSGSSDTVTLVSAEPIRSTDRPCA